MSKALSPHSLSLVLALLVLAVNTGRAQTTQFSYQGKLVDGALPANANYDFEFRLFATGTGGAAIATQTRLGVPVSNGILTLQLDFGGQFDGSARWLEVAVKPAGSPNPLTVLTPRQPLTSTPYSIRSLSSARADVATNSLQLGGINSSQYVLTTDSRMTDPRSPLPNSSNYVQNSTTPQASTNFNISGNGTAAGTLSANVVNAASQYNIDGDRVLSNAGSFNLFAGVLSGSSNTTGGLNSFFGVNAGFKNTTGNHNSFFGFGAGNQNSTGNRNSSFGTGAGLSNTSGDDNAFFGEGAGYQNLASFNSFFGSLAGDSNTAGNENSFFGAGAGTGTTSGDDNSFFGRNAGSGNTTGNSNAFFGYQAGNTNTTGSNNTIIGNGADVASGNLNFATAIGAGAVVVASNTIMLGRGTDVVRVPGNLRVDLLGTAGSTSLCHNSSGFIASCSSSLRYKIGVKFFLQGLDIVRRLRPVSFDWRDGGRRDVGFGAEAVEKIEPLLVTYNQRGEIEGVKYGQLTTVLVNAVNEQQTQIETQKEQIAEQQRLLRQEQQQNQVQQKQLRQQQQLLHDLKKLLCLSHPKAEVCR